MASNSDPENQENVNAPNQPMIVTMNQSPQAQPETIQGFQPQSPNQQGFQVQPQMQNHNGYQVQPPMQYQYGYQAQSPMQYQYAYQSLSPMQHQQVYILQSYEMQNQQQDQIENIGKCCCCIPMKIGLIVIAIVGIVIGSLQIGFLGFGFTVERFSEDTYFIVFMSFLELLYVAYIIACALLIAGAITRKALFFWPYLFVAVIVFIVDFGLVICVSYRAYLYSLIFRDSNRDLDSNLKDEGTFLFAFYVIGVIIFLSSFSVSIYFIVVVVKEINRINQR